MMDALRQEAALRGAVFNVSYWYLQASTPCFRFVSLLALHYER